MDVLFRQAAAEVDRLCAVYFRVKGTLSLDQISGAIPVALGRVGTRRSCKRVV